MTCRRGIETISCQRCPKLETALKRLTESFDSIDGDEAGSEAGEGLVDVGTSFVADRLAAEAVEPSVRALNHPPVTAHLFAAVYATPADARHDPACPAFVPARSSIVGFVGVQFVRPVSRPPPPTVAQGWDGIEGGSHHDAVVPVGPAQVEAAAYSARW